jgi:uncharacterized protein YoxC
MGNNYLGTGVFFDGIKRQYDSFVESNLRNSNSDLQSQKPVVDYTNRVIDVMGGQTSGLTSALDQFFSSARSLAADPASTVQRTSFLRSADGVSSRFGELSTQLDLIATETRQGIESVASKINTLTSQLDGTVVMTAANDHRYVQSFTTSATAESLTEVSLDLSATGTTSFDVQLWGNFNNQPLSRNYRLAQARNVTLTSPYVISSFVEGPVLLAPSTTYWLYVQRVGGADLSWGFTDDQGVANGYKVGAEGPWNISSATSLRTAVNVVPEPSTYAMALAGLASGGYLVRRRRKRA